MTAGALKLHRNIPPALAEFWGLLSIASDRRISDRHLRLHIASIAWQNTAYSLLRSPTKVSPVAIPIVFVQEMVSGVEARGMAAAPLLADAGIASELLLEPSASVTAVRYVELFRLIIERQTQTISKPGTPSPENDSDEFGAQRLCAGRVLSAAVRPHRQA